MLDVIKKARERHRNAVEQLYEDKCTVIEYQSVKDPVTMITKKQEVIVLTNQPCKLSFSTSNTTDEGDNVATVSQEVKLFVSPNISINAGSKIFVIHDSIEHVYKSSGEPSAYFTHQEIALELFKGWV
ncbi:hypothetical protein [Anaerosporobacter sp.]